MNDPVNLSWSGFTVRKQIRITIAAMAMIIMLAAASSASSAENDSQKMPVIKIGFPAANSTVPSSIEVNGTIEPHDIPLGWHMWVLVNPISNPGQWWPQGSGEITPWNGTWYTQAVIGGGDADIGKWFNIMAVLVNEKDNGYLNKWVTETSKIRTWPSITIPASADSNWGDSVKVRRSNPQDKPNSELKIDDAMLMQKTA